MSDVKMLFISRDDVLDLLKKAFDEGWGGYQDLRDSTAESLLDELLENKRRKVENGRSIPVAVRLDPVDWAPSPESTFVPDVVFSSGGDSGGPTPTPVNDYRPVQPQGTRGAGQRTFEWNESPLTTTTINVQRESTTTDLMEIHQVGDRLWTTSSGGHTIEMVDNTAQG